ncbi:MAG: hypothetical protein DRI84_01360 [Bacteroidetes bacterium]|nr:MAG: hypothetical protein DRI84_01360 [Bacteroidota bacterium]
MKTIKYIILILVISITSQTYAQTDSTQIGAQSNVPVPTPKTEYQKYRLGVYGDMGLSWLKPKSTEYESQGSRFSYNYGLIVDVNFTENYTFSTGININSLGGKLKYSDSLKVEASDSVATRGVMNRKYQVSYIEIPLFLKLKTNQMGYFTPFVQLGLRNGFRLSSFSDDEFIYDGKTEDNEDVDIEEETAFYTLSFSVGIGTEYAVSKSFSAYAILSYDNGLTTAINGENYIGTSLTKQNAMFKKIGLTIGFLF